MENYVDAERVAEFLGYKSAVHVRRLAGRGVLPHRRIGGSLRFRLSEIERWVAESDGARHAPVLSLQQRRTA